MAAANYYVILMINSYSDEIAMKSSFFKHSYSTTLNSENSVDFFILEFPFHEMAIKYLSRSEILSAALVCLQWKNIFSNQNIWKAVLCRDFSISIDTLSCLNISISYLDLYDNLTKILQHLSALQKRFSQRGPYLNYNYLYYYVVQNLNSLAFLSLCLNDIEYFKKHASDEEFLSELPLWIELSIFLNRLEIFKYLFEKFRYPPSIELVYFGVIAGDLEVVKFLIGFFCLSPEASKEYLNEMLLLAAETGNLELVQHLLNPKNKFSLKITNYVIINAASSGNVKLLKFLLRLKKTNFKEAYKSVNNSKDSELSDYQHDQDLLIKICHNGFRSGTLTMTKYIVGSQVKISSLGIDFSKINLGKHSAKSIEFIHQKFKLNLNMFDLECAAGLGNLDQVQYLLRVNLIPSKKVLDLAAYSGNLALVQLLLDPKFNLVPDQETINGSVISGNPKLVLYLLDYNKAFKLTKQCLSELILTNHICTAKLYFNEGFNWGDFKEIFEAYTVNQKKHSNFNLLYWLGFYSDLPKVLNSDFSGLRIKLLKCIEYFAAAVKLIIDETSNITSLPYYKLIFFSITKKFKKDPLEEAYDIFPSYFYRLVEKILQKPDKFNKDFFCKFLSIERIQLTPNVFTQYRLLKFSEVSFVKLTLIKNEIQEMNEAIKCLSDKDRNRLDNEIEAVVTSYQEGKNVRPVFR